MNLNGLQLISDVELFENINLSRFLTIRINSIGTIAIVKTLSALKELVLKLRENKISYHVVGLGSNQILLNTDNVFFIKLQFKEDGKEIININDLYFDASTTLVKLLKIAKTYHLGGWELMSGIPASLGGAIAMNAGTSLGEMKDIVLSIDILKESGNVVTVSNPEFGFVYRGNSYLKKGDIIIGSRLGYKSIDESVGFKIDSYLAHRAQTQPLSTKNCGCVFKNPSPDMPAGKLIEILGLKGLSYKGLRISSVHGNFIEHVGGATPEDFKSFVEDIQKRIFEKSGIKIELEVKLI